MNPATDQRRVPARHDVRDAVHHLAGLGLQPLDVAQLLGLDPDAVARLLGAPAPPAEDRP